MVRIFGDMKFCSDLHRKHSRASTVAKGGVHIWPPAAKPANFGFCDPQNGCSGNPSTRPSAVPGNTKMYAAKPEKSLKKFKF
jgi:hypothetical protein